MTPPDIVLFDLGNVMVRWDPRNLYRRRFARPEAADTFVRTVVNMDWHADNDRGVPMAETARALIARFPEHEDHILAYETGWREMFDGYVSGVPEIFDALLSRGTPLYALTNLPGGKWAETADLFPRLRQFRDVIISGDEKVIKPDRRIYEITLGRIGAPAGRVFFTDDNPENIRAADALGLHTHLFQGAEGLRDALIGHGLLDA